MILKSTDKNWPGGMKPPGFFFYPEAKKTGLIAVLTAVLLGAGADIASLRQGFGGGAQTLPAAGQENFARGDKLPNFEGAVISSQKFIGYALNPDHSSGKHKAVVFDTVLGYHQSNANDLIRQIYSKLPYCEAILRNEDNYGKRYAVDIPITGPNGGTAIVRTGWIVSSGSEIPKLTTVFVK